MDIFSNTINSISNKYGKGRCSETCGLLRKKLKVIIYDVPENTTHSDNDNTAIKMTHESVLII